MHLLASVPLRNIVPFVFVVALSKALTYMACLLRQAREPFNVDGMGEEEVGEAPAVPQRTAAPHWDPSPAPCYGALARALAAADIGERRAASSSPSSSSSGLGSASGDASPARSAGEGADGRASAGFCSSGFAEAPRLGAATSNGAPQAERATLAESSGGWLRTASQRTQRADEPPSGQLVPSPGPNSGPLGAAEAEGLEAPRPFMGSGGQACGGQAGAPAHFQVDQSFEVAGVGSVVAGTVVAGTVRVGQRLLLGPTQRGAFAPVTVTCIQRAQARPCAAQAFRLGV